MLGWISGRVYDAVTGYRITDVEVKVGGTAFNKVLDGYYFGVMPPGVYELAATTEGYFPKSFPGVVISGGSLMTKDFGLSPILLKLNFIIIYSLYF